MRKADNRKFFYGEVIVLPQDPSESYKSYLAGHRQSFDAPDDAPYLREENTDGPNQRWCALDTFKELSFLDLVATYHKFSSLENARFSHMGTIQTLQLPTDTAQLASFKEYGIDTLDKHRQLWRIVSCVATVTFAAYALDRCDERPSTKTCYGEVLEKLLHDKLFNGKDWDKSDSQFNETQELSEPKFTSCKLWTLEELRACLYKFNGEHDVVDASEMTESERFAVIDSFQKRPKVSTLNETEVLKRNTKIKMAFVQIAQAIVDPLNCEKVLYDAVGVLSAYGMDEGDLKTHVNIVNVENLSEKFGSKLQFANKKL